MASDGSVPRKQRKKKNCIKHRKKALEFIFNLAEKVTAFPSTFGFCGNNEEGGVGFGKMFRPLSIYIYLDHLFR